MRLDSLWSALERMWSTLERTWTSPVVTKQDPSIATKATGSKNQYPAWKSLCGDRKCDPWTWKYTFRKKYFSRRMGEVCLGLESGVRR